MAYCLFVDESGQDRRESPYEVLAGVAIEDRDLWNLIQAIQQVEVLYFGCRYSADHRELKAKKILKRKVFRHASQQGIDESDRATLAKQCLENARNATRESLTALAQAKIAYVKEVFDLCARYRVKVFASIVSKEARLPASYEHLRKDYAYLFERFFYFLEDTDGNASGFVVFDELEKTKSHLLVNQMDRYFKKTEKGQLRAGLIVPEPFFVHSDLTTGIQIADLVAYILSWGFRIPPMKEPERAELAPFVGQVKSLRHRTLREIDGREDFVVWSISFIRDLRPSSEQGQ